MVTEADEIELSSILLLPSSLDAFAFVVLRVWDMGWYVFYYSIRSSRAKTPASNFRFAKTCS